MMAEIKAFTPVKLICGIISSKESIFKKAEDRLVQIYKRVDHRSPSLKFNFTDYYEKQMGSHLKRKFLSFANLIFPEELSKIKIRTNELEEEMRKELKASQRVVNLDPGYLTPSALIMATSKDFSHRIPLQKGIYAHLELLFTKKEARTLNWTYPDYETDNYQKFFMEVRKIYIDQLRKARLDRHT